MESVLGGLAEWRNSTVTCPAVSIQKKGCELLLAKQPRVKQKQLAKGNASLPSA